MTRYCEVSLTDGMAEYLNGRGIDYRAQVGNRLGEVGSNPPPAYARFKGMLAIPYLGPGDKPRSIRFRCTKEHDHDEHHHGKYNSAKGDPPRIYHVKTIAEATDEIAICEGELDTIILNAIGVPAVGIPGANLWRPHFSRIFAGFSKVWVFGDQDEPGQELVSKVLSELRQAKAVNLPFGDAFGGNDVSDVYKEHGADALLELVGRKK